jgi:hypothetical protein
MNWELGLRYVEAFYSTNLVFQIVGFENIKSEFDWNLNQMQKLKT